jgi:hypothetical protein
MFVLLAVFLFGAREKRQVRVAEHARLPQMNLNMQ